MILTCAKCGKISVPFPCEHCGSEDFVKTVTRRMIKNQPEGKHFILERRRHSNLVAIIADDVIMWRPYGGAPLQPMPIDEIAKYAPYQVGDELWVRETWSITQLEAPGGSLEYPNILYKTDSSTRLVLNQPEVWKYNIPNNIFKWRPSIHMPKWAARIWLEVLKVRPEQLQKITLEDIKSEGIEYDNKYGRGHLREKFQTLWDSLNEKRGYPWELNPWVWRYEFKRIKK
jgi:hypothetical protein